MYLVHKSTTLTHLFDVINRWMVRALMSNIINIWLHLQYHDSFTDNIQDQCFLYFMFAMPMLMTSKVAFIHFHSLNICSTIHFIEKLFRYGCHIIVYIFFPLIIDCLVNVWIHWIFLCCNFIKLLPFEYNIFCLWLRVKVILGFHSNSWFRIWEQVNHFIAR